MEKKIKINFEQEEQDKYVNITHLGCNIQVKSRLTFAEEVYLIGEYVEHYFNHLNEGIVPSSQYSYMEAETLLMGLVYNMCTNIEMEEEDFDNDIYADPVLWGKVKYQISNFKDFAYKLNRIVQDTKETERMNLSIGKVVSELSEKLFSMMEDLGGASPESIQELISHGKDMAETLKAYNLTDALAVNEKENLGRQVSEEELETLEK